jgi:hypothetical protein
MVGGFCTRTQGLQGGFYSGSLCLLQRDEVDVYTTQFEVSRPEVTEYHYVITEYHYVIT